MQFVCLYYNIALDSDAKQSETDVAHYMSEKENHISEGTYELYGILKLGDTYS